MLRTGQARVMSVNRFLEEIVQSLAEFQPAYLLVYPTLLAHLLEAFERTAQRPVFLRGVRTLGETVTERLRENTRWALGLESADTYSSQEGGVITGDLDCQTEGKVELARTDSI